MPRSVKDESEGKTLQNTDRYNLGQYYENERRFQGNIDQEGKWYFYNQSALTFGRTEFRRRWGDRKLEDNWRRIKQNKSKYCRRFQVIQMKLHRIQTDTSAAANDYKKPAVLS